MPAALLLDLGGVWLQDGDFTERARWAAAHGLTADDVYHAYIDAIGPGWEGGRSEQEICDRLLAGCGVGPDELAALLAALHAHETLDPSLTALVAELRAAGTKVGIISNAGRNARAELTARFPFDDLADVMLISAEVGVSKPHPHIYEEAMRRLDVTADECVFVDDKPANVDAAIALGMTGIVCTDITQTCADITAAFAPG